MKDKIFPASKMYIDSIHGFTATSTSKTMAWQLIRYECKRLRVEVPTFDKISELKSLTKGEK